MSRPSPGELFREAAVLAHGFGWNLDTILDLEHSDRRRFVGELHVITNDA